MYVGFLCSFRVVGFRYLFCVSQFIRWLMKFLMNGDGLWFVKAWFMGFQRIFGCLTCVGVPMPKSLST